MSAGRLVFALVMVAIILLGGLAAMGHALEEGGAPVIIEGEEFTPEGGQTIELDASNLEGVTYGSQADIEVRDNQGEIIPQPGNYEWNENNGTIYVVESSTLSAESNAVIDYRYSEPSETAVGLLGVFDGTSQILGLLTIVIGVAVVFASLRVFGGAR